jgi:CDP-diacylglycerol--serine O-phosphatidyltransferase
LSDLLVFLPVLGAVVLHAPVLAFDLLKPLKRPIDGGRGWFGANKTWRGALAMFTGVVLATGVVWELMPDALRGEHWVFVGALIGLGTVAGELPNSYLKRRLGIGPGERRLTPGGVALIVYDQADFVPAIAVALLPVWVMPLEVLAVGFVAVAAVHFGINVIGYAIGAREKPI